MRASLIILFALLISTKAFAMAVDVSSSIIKVTTGFNGAAITVFGNQEKDGQLVIVVEGPPTNVTVRKKGQVMGLWTNTGSRRFVGIPAFYQMAANSPVDQIAPEDTLRTNRISLTGFLSSSSGDNDADYAPALVRIQNSHALYTLKPADITYVSPQLFKATFDLPPIVRPGAYMVSAYLFQNGALVDKGQVPFEVVPEGISADLRHFATHSSLLYGVAGVLMALMAGWLANVLLKRD